MTRRVVVVLACASALAAVQAASAIESTIMPGISIGKVRLGMTASQVKRLLGADYLVNDAENIGGKRYVEYGWDFSSWAVTFVQRGRSLRVVQVSTTLRSQRTPSRVGPGTTWQRLVRAYPGGVCAFYNAFGGLGNDLGYLVPQRGGTQTIWTLRAIFNEKTQRTVGYVVYEVHVRTPFEPMPAFARTSVWRCDEGWETAAVPHPRGPKR